MGKGKFTLNVFQVAQGLVALRGEVIRMLRIFQKIFVTGASTNPLRLKNILREC